MESDGRRMVGALCRSLRRGMASSSSGAALPSALALSDDTLFSAARYLVLSAGELDLSTDYDQEALMDMELLRAALAAVTHLRLQRRRHGGGGGPGSVVVDLASLGSREGGLRSLELLGLEVSSLSGLQHLRPRMEALLVSGCRDLCDGAALASLPGDGACSTPSPWPRLTSLSLRRCLLTRLDAALLCATPNLTRLDLSFNALEELDGALNLAALQVLNLSFNKLRRIPELPKSSTLVTLDVSHNCLDTLQGLCENSCLNLSDLDLSFNLLCGHRCLAPICLLPRLCRLGTAGNPMAADREHHRRRTLAWVHRSVNPAAFALDGIALAGQELGFTGMAMLVPTAPHTPQNQQSSFFPEESEEKVNAEVALPADMVAMNPDEIEIITEEESSIVSRWENI